MSMLSTLDYVIIVVALIGSLWGAIKGFFDEVAQKFGYVAGFFVAVMFCLPLSQTIKNAINTPQWFSAFLAYVILFFIGFCIIKALGSMLTKIFETAHLNWVNNLLGFVLGLVEALLVLGVIETVLTYQSLVSVQEAFGNSYISSNILLPFCNSILKSVNGLV